MKIAVRWAKGTIRVEINLNDPVKLLLQKISDQLKIEPKFLVLFLDENRQKLIDTSGSCLRAHIENGSFIYLNILTSLPDVPVAQMVSKVDIQEEYVKSGEKLPAHLQRVRDDYGSKTVTPAFLEYRESLKPAIIEQVESSCYAIRIGQEPLKVFQKKSN